MKETLAELQTRAAKAECRVEIDFDATTGEIEDGIAVERGSYTVRFVPLEQSEPVTAPVGWGGLSGIGEVDFKVEIYKYSNEDGAATFDPNCTTYTLPDSPELEADFEKFVSQIQNSFDSEYDVRVEYDYLGAMPALDYTEEPHINGVPISLLEEYDEYRSSPPESETPSSAAAFDKCKPGDV